MIIAIKKYQREKLLPMTLSDALQLILTQRRKKKNTEQKLSIRHISSVLSHRINCYTIIPTTERIMSSQKYNFISQYQRW